MSKIIKTDTICEEIRFSSDSFDLKGVLHRPEGVQRPPVVIGSHGLFSSGDSPKQIELARKCNQSGMAFFRFDHRGCGQSQGDFNDVTSLIPRCQDVISAVNVLKTRDDIGEKTGLFGSSMGGPVCIRAAGIIPVDAMVTVAAPVRISSRAEAIRAIERSRDSENPDPLFYKKDLRFDISDTLSKLHHILIFHGEKDDVIPLSHAREIYQKAGNPKKLIIQKKGDHRISNINHQKEFIREAVKWFKAELL